eukprot:g25110.t1
MRKEHPRPSSRSARRVSDPQSSTVSSNSYPQTARRQDWRGLSGSYASMSRTVHPCSAWACPRSFRTA